VNALDVIIDGESYSGEALLVLILLILLIVMAIIWIVNNVPRR
jgi:hypothetical protein